jgi:hypothetical protein|tara:strand:- start:596 stop:799 length:204 start_codon:yes stop_codon:yes gene_type:complete
MNHSNHFSQKKPIEDVLQNLESLIIDIKGIKTDIHHIKEYIRKETVKQQLEDERIEKEYVKPSGWFS